MTNTNPKTADDCRVPEMELEVGPCSVAARFTDAEHARPPATPLPAGWRVLADEPGLAEARPMVEGVVLRSDNFLAAVYRCFDGNFGWGFGRGTTAAQLADTFYEYCEHGLSRDEACKQASAEIQKRAAAAAKRRARARGAK